MLAGVELTHVPPKMIADAAKMARDNKAELIVVHGETIVELGQSRQILSELDAGDFCGDRLEYALHVVRHILFGIPQVEVTWATLQVDENDTLCFAPTCAAGGSSLRLHLEHVRQR